MKKWILLLGIIFIFVFVYPVSRAENVPLAAHNPLSAALQATGAELGQVSINGWCKVDTTQRSDVKLESMTKQLMDQLGLEAQYKLDLQKNSQQRIMRAEAASPAIHVVTVAEELTTNANVIETYLVINVEVSTQDDTVIQQWQDKIKNALINFDKSPHITTCLIGWLDGKLRNDELKSRLADAFAAVDAKVIDSQCSESNSSFNGYSAAIDDSLQVGEDRLNLNIAMRYSGYDKRTYVFVGSPVITLEY